MLLPHVPVLALQVALKPAGQQPLEPILFGGVALSLTRADPPEQLHEHHGWHWARGRKAWLDKRLPVGDTHQL